MTTHFSLYHLPLWRVSSFGGGRDPFGGGGRELLDGGGCEPSGGGGPEYKGFNGQLMINDTHNYNTSDPS
jgi:hypothetical protein